MLKETLISKVDLKKFLLQRIHHVIGKMIYFFTIDNETSKLTLWGFDFVGKKEKEVILTCEIKAKENQLEDEPKVLCAIFVTQKANEDIKE